MCLWHCYQEARGNDLLQLLPPQKKNVNNKLVNNVFRSQSERKISTSFSLSGILKLVPYQLFSKATPSVLRRNVEALTALFDLN